ncbi:MAG: hypothetical protein AAB706_04345 [Patescibacteria group bacterium]
MFSYLLKQKHKSAAAFVFIVALLIPNLTLLIPQRVQAQLSVPTFETNPALVVSTPATAANTLATSLSTGNLYTKETVWDVLLYVAKQAVITTILNSIQTWAESGFEGGPSFVQDPEAFLRGVGDQAAGSLIEELAPFLCEPFRISILSGLALNQSKPFGEISCTLTDVIGNIDDFVNGNFSAGGMDGWFSMTQNRGNNPYDVYATAQMAIHIKVGGQQAKEVKILDFGRGFLSSRDCKVRNANGECTEYGPIKTPGSVIETQINHAFGSGVRQLEIADEINETIAAVASALINKILTTGLAAVQ